MWYLVNVDHNITVAYITRSDCEGVFFKKSCVSNAVDRTDDDMLLNGREERGNLRN